MPAPRALFNGGMRCKSAATLPRSISMNAIKFAIAGIALSGALGGASAEARGRDDVQFSISVGNAGPALLIAEPPRYQVAPVLVRDEGYFYGPRHGRAYGHRYHPRPTRWDHDGDGVPNRYDRVYNPRWDRDGDGIPNRYDHRNDWRGRR
jgi:hypothetical protein